MISDKFGIEQGNEHNFIRGGNEFIGNGKESQELCRSRILKQIAVGILRRIDLVKKSAKLSESDGIVPGILNQYCDDNKCYENKEHYLGPIVVID